MLSRAQDAEPDGAATVAAARAGDRAAQHELFCRHQQTLYGFLRQLTGDDDVAADLAQEAFVRAFRALPRLRSEAAFGAWLLRIGHNLVLDRARHEARRASAELDELPDGGPGVGRRLEQAELRGVVAKAVAALPLPQREVVVLHHLQGLEVEAIARALGLPEGTVKSRLGRARVALRRRLSPYVED